VPVAVLGIEEILSAEPVEKSPYHCTKQIGESLSFHSAVQIGNREKALIKVSRSAALSKAS